MRAAMVALYARRMRRPVVAVVAVIAALVVAIAYRCHGGSDGADTASGGSAGAASGGALAGGARTGRGGRGALDAQPASVTGRVTRAADGAPVAGAVVSLAPSEVTFDDASTAADAPTLVAISDASGAYTIRDVRAGSYALAATARGFRPASRPHVAVAPGEQLAGADLALVAGGTRVRGIVTDVGGGAIADARVRARHEQQMSLVPGAELVTTTGADGRYELYLDPGPYAVAATHDDYARAESRVAVAAKDVTADFQLVPAGTIRGVVVARDTRRPVPGALVTATGRRGAHATVHASPTGAFVLPNLAGGALALTATGVADGHSVSSTAPVVVELAIGQTASDVRVVVDRAYTIAGRVVRAGTGAGSGSAGGVGIAGVRVGAMSPTSQSQVAADELTDDDGAFAIRGVRPGMYLLYAFGDDAEPDIGKQATISDRDVTDVRIELAAGVTIAGRVEPPGAAAVHIELEGAVGFGNMFDAVKAAFVHGTADPTTGAFELRHAPAGKLAVVAQTDDGHTGRVSITVGDADQRDVVVPLSARASIAGHVVDEHHAPVAGATVHAAIVGHADAQLGLGGGAPDATTDADGAFRIVGLDAGSATIAVEDAQGVLEQHPKDAAFDVGAGSAIADVTIVVEARDGAISGEVVDASGKPVADTWVSANRDLGSDSEGDDDDSPGYGVAPALTGADGRFAFARLAGGAYHVVADGPAGASRADAQHVAVGAHVTLHLAPLGTLSGRVTASGAPVASYQLTCRGPSEVDRPVSSPDGSFELEHLAPGSWTCTADADAGVGSGAVDVPSGSATLNIPLAAYASLTGGVLGADGKPLAGAQVLVQPASGDNESMIDAFFGTAPTTDASGRFVVERVPAGSGTVMVAAPAGFTPLATQPYTATAGQRVDVGTIAVHAGSGSGSGGP